MPFSLESLQKYNVSLYASVLENSASEKLFGLRIDRTLNVNEYVTIICDKASRKVQAIARIFPYIPKR